MYDISQIQTAFASLVGYKSTTSIPLPESLTATDSGLLINDVHPLLTPKNLKAYTPDEYEDEADAATRLTNYLTEARSAAISKAVTSFINEKLVRRSGASTLQSRTIYNTSAPANNYSQEYAGFVGWRLRTGTDNNMKTGLRRVAFHGTQAATITLKLINTYIGEVASFDMVYTEAGKQQWFTLPDTFVLSSYDPDSGANGGTWFVGYDAREYAGRAVNKGIDWLASCRGCGITYESSSIAVLKLRGVSILPAKYNTEYDFEDVCNDTFGLNLDFYSGCDYTQFLVDNKLEFASYIQLYTGIHMLRHMVANPDILPTRQSAQVQRLAEELRFDLNGDADRVTKGLYGDLGKAWKAVHIDTQGLSSICFGPDKTNRARVTYR